MKKTLLLSFAIVTSLLFCNTTFAYDPYTDNGTTYSNEQFRRDIKSYLDDQTTRQQNQDLLNNINAGYSNVKTQFEIDQMQKELDKAKANNASLDDQIKQTQELINQQNQIMIEQKKLRDQEQKEYDYKNSVCKEVEAKYAEQGVMQSLSDNCAKYGVYIKVESIQKPVTNTQKVKNAKQPVYLDEKPASENIIKKYNLLDLDTSTTTSTTTIQTETPVKKSFYRKTIDKIRSLFNWF